MQPPKVLLCGAHPSLLQTLRSSGGATFRVEQAAPPYRFPNNADMQHFGLVVVLHQQHEPDAPATIRNCRRTHPELPVIALTADYSGATTRLLFVAGAADVLPLPAEPERVQGTTGKRRPCATRSFPAMRGWRRSTAR